MAYTTLQLTIIKLVSTINFNYKATPSNNTDFKGAVHWHCFDVKPFNLSACFITKCDVKRYDTYIKMADHGQQCTIMYEL